MKYRSISLNETTAIELTKFLTKKFANKEVSFSDSTDHFNKIDGVNDKLIPFESVGLVKHTLYERPFQWILDVPDEPKLYGFYRLVKIVDDTLARAFRAYHMRLINKEQLKQVQKKVNEVVVAAKNDMEATNVH